LLNMKQRGHIACYSAIQMRAGREIHGYHKGSGGRALDVAGLFIEEVEKQVKEKGDQIIIKSAKHDGGGVCSGVLTAHAETTRKLC